MSYLLSNQAWDAILSEEYELAVSLYDKIIPSQPSVGDINNRGIAKLLLARPFEALEDFRFAQREMPFVQTAYIGTSLWMIGDKNAACLEWSSEVTKQELGNLPNVTDSAGGIILPSLLWWASAHQGCAGWRSFAESTLLSKVKTAQCKKSSWPGEIARFLMGMSDEEGMMRACSDDVQIIDDKQRCQCLFYLSAQSLNDKNIDASKKYVKSALEMKGLAILDAEYHLCKAVPN